MVHLILVAAGLLTLLATVACESYNATQTAEAPAKEAEEALDEMRKSVDDLPNCKGARDVVYTLEWKQGKDAGQGYLSKIENYRTLDVEVLANTATITCAGEAWRKNGTYIGEVTYWVRKNKRDRKGTHYSGYSVGVAQPSSRTQEPVEEHTPTVVPTPTVRTGPCPSAVEDELFSEKMHFISLMGFQHEKIDKVTATVIERPARMNDPSWQRQAKTVLNSFNALARELSDDEIPEPVYTHGLQFAESVRTFTAAYARGMQVKNPVRLEEAEEHLLEAFRRSDAVVDAIKNFCE